MHIDDFVALADSDGPERNNLIGFLEANRGDLTWQYARELFTLAFPGESSNAAVLKVP